MIRKLTASLLQAGELTRREAPVSRFIPYTRHVDNATLRTKDGYLLQVIEVSGISFETVDQIEINIQKDRRSTLLQGISNSRFAVYHHIIRRKLDQIPEGSFANPWCAAFDQAYRAKLEQKQLFVNQQFLTIVRRPAQGKVGLISEVGKALFGSVDLEASRVQQQDDLKALHEAADHLLKTLASYGARRLGVYEADGVAFSEPLSFLSYLIHFNWQKVRLPGMGIANYLPAKRLSFGKETFEVRGAESHDLQLGAVLSVKEYCTATGPGMLDHLLRLPHEFVLTQSFGFVDRQTALSSMQLTKRKIQAGQEGAYSLEADMDVAIDNLASGKSVFGEHHLTIVAHGNTATKLNQSISAISGSLVDIGIVALREDLNMEAAFWAQLPGNFSFIARRSLIHNRNFASLASLHNFPTGKQNGSHWGDAVSLLETTSGTPYWFNYHHKDVGNFVIIGPTGSGKTVLLNFLLAQAQRMNPRCVFFDKDRGAEIFIRAIGGDYRVIRAGEPTGFNPLQIADSAESRAFLRDWLKLLARTDDATPLTPRDAEMIASAIDENFEIEPRHRRLANLSAFFSGYSKETKNSLESRLAKWHGTGEKAWLFDNPCDQLEFNNATIGLDLTSILDDPTSRTPWLMYVFHRVDQLLDGSKTILMLDEGWKMLDDPIFAAQIKDWEKTVRKRNGILGFATQSTRDALNSSVGNAIIEQSPTQIFLPNPRADEKEYCEGFGLTKHEFKIVRELSPDTHCFLLRHHTDSVIARLDLSGLDDFIAVLSGRTETVRLLDVIRQEQGDAVENWLPEFLERRNAA